MLTLTSSAQPVQPESAVQEYQDVLRIGRKTKVPPSQANRRKSEPAKRPGKKYDVGNYYHAIRRACERANLDKWHPNQLRHSAATRLRREFGVEMARIILGHKTAFTTEMYAETDRDQAIAVMARFG